MYNLFIYFQSRKKMYKIIYFTYKCNFYLIKNNFIIINNNNNNININNNNNNNNNNNINININNNNDFQLFSLYLIYSLMNKIFNIKKFLHHFPFESFLVLFLMYLLFLSISHFHFLLILSLLNNYLSLLEYY